MLDFVEIPGSMGTSSLLMESKGHRVYFKVDNNPSYLEIKRSGWTSFSYRCVIDDVDIKEATQTVAENQEEVFRINLNEYAFTADEESTGQIAWYIVNSTRLADNQTTTVHR